LEDAESLLLGAAPRADPFAGVIRIGVCPASLEWRLLDPTALLLRRHPRVRFDVTGASFERMVQQLRNGAVDVALGYDAAFSEWPELKREPIPALRSVLFVRQGHPILSRSPIEQKDLAEYDFTSPSDSRPYGAVIRNIYESQGVDWTRRLHTVDYFPMVRRIVETTDAIGVVDAAHAARETFRQRFATLDDVSIFPPADLCAAVRARWEPQPAVRALLKAFRDAAGSSPTPPS